MKEDLTGLWRFQPDPTRTGERRGYPELGYDDHRWREVRVPVDFETCHPLLDTYEGAGWFRRWVSVPEDWRERRVALSFAGVNAHAKVWVNGYEVGNCDDPFLPFDFDVEDYLSWGRENLVAVRVDNERRPGEVPGLQRGWRNFGGILREVEVTPTDPCYLARFVVQAGPHGPGGDAGGHLDLQAFVHNSRGLGADASLNVDLVDDQGSVIAHFASPSHLVPVGEEVPLAVGGGVPDATPWSPDEPELYQVVVMLQVDGLTVDTQRFRIGFRTIEAREGQLLLNGEPVYLTGFNRHEDSPTRNMCPDLALVRRDLKAMKEAGANFVRLCHYPHHPAELDLCDELGLLVMDEIPLYWWNGLVEGEVAAAQKLAAAKRQLETMIWRDRTHPSVVFWSVSNETEEERPEVAAGNVELVNLAKALDPSRLVVHVSDHWREHPNFEADDVICVNGYPSVRGFLSDRDPDYDLARSTTFWREGLARLHELHPDKPILVTEFGYISYDEIADNAVSGDLHADVIEHEFAGMDAAYVCGATIWCWADHAWPPNYFAFCNYLAVSPYGVLTRDRREKPAVRRARQLFRAKQGMLVEPEAAAEPHTGPSGYPVMMVRPHLDRIPHVPFPEGFTIRPMRLDEAGLWTDIWRDAEEFSDFGPDVFHRQFGQDLPAMQWRSFIVENERGVAVATITVWYDRTFKGEDYGQIHWVAVRRSVWGKGIGKAMLSYALEQMAQWHDRAFLGTQTKRLAAIKIYLDFGFVPDLEPPGAVKAWREVKENLDHPVLNRIEAL
ncbi:MAG: GNAT family N-acetyltransferase [Anaerolineae bacterium]